MSELNKWRKYFWQIKLWQRAKQWKEIFEHEIILKRAYHSNQFNLEYLVLLMVNGLGEYLDMYGHLVRLNSDWVITM